MKSKFNLFLLCALLGSFANAEIKIENKWQSTGNLGDTKVFEKNKMSLTILEGVTPTERNLDSKNYKDEVTNSLQTRKTTLDLLGYENWIASDIKFLATGPKKLVTIKGTYKKDNAEFEFIEWQVYSGKKYYSLQLENKIGEPSAATEISYLTKLVEGLQ